MVARKKRERERDSEGTQRGLVHTNAAIAENLSMWCQSKDPVLLRNHVESQSFTIVDMRNPMQPITFASDGFVSMTGYSREEVVGRNCNFLQGPGTDRATVQAIRDALDKGLELSVEILNYRKDGTPFWNRLSLIPIFRSFEQPGTTGSGGVRMRDSTDHVASSKNRAVSEFLGVQQELPTNPVSTAAQQATTDAQGMVEPVAVIGSQLSIESAHAELMSLMASVVNCGLGCVSKSFCSSATAHQPDHETVAFGLCTPSAAGIPLTHASKGFLQLTGYDLEEVVGQSLMTVLQPQGTNGDDSTPVEIELGWLRRLGIADAEVEAEAGGVHGSVRLDPSGITRKMHCVKKDGTKWWCLALASPVADQKGHIGSVVIGVIDISQDYEIADGLHLPLSSGAAELRSESNSPKYRAIAEGNKFAPTDHT